MRAEFLPFSPPSIGEDEIAAVVDTLRSSWITTGPKTKRFQEAFAASVGAQAALAVNSCTAALHVALASAGIGPGDEVITTTMTFCSSVNVIEHVGARPVLVDVEPDTLNLDPVQVRKAIGPRTKAILPVHYAGHPVDLDAIEAAAAGCGALVVEDAAHGFPARYKGRMIGGGANPTAFSFYATKNLTTAEGGMLTGPAARVEPARVIALHGMDRDAWKRYDKGGAWMYDVVAPGFKYNMTDIQAALGLCQLERMAEFQRRRRAIVSIYQTAFTGHRALQVPVERPEVEHAWHLYVLRLRPAALAIKRDAFIEALKERNIGTSVHFIPVHMHSFYKNKYGYAKDAFPVAADAFSRCISLPLNPRMSETDALDVVAAVLDLVEQHRA
jgi:dTDP-4-amino-4,6-dideoxygalactose transaminase